MRFGVDVMRHFGSQRIGIFIGFGVLVAISSVIYAQTSGGGTSYQSVKIAKSVELGSLWQGSVNISVSGMQETDVINIVPSENQQFSAKVLTSEDRTIQLDNKNINVPGEGAALSDTSLVVSTTNISFARPVMNGKVLLFLELPQGTNFSISYNGSTIGTNGQLYSSLAVRAGALSKGAETMAMAYTHTIFPQLLDRDPNEDVLIGQQRYLVAYSKLQLKKSSQLPNVPFIKLSMDVDEQGIVENVSVVSPINSTEIHQIVSAWEFVPYVVNGTPVKFSTVFVRD